MISMPYSRLPRIGVLLKRSGVSTRPARPPANRNCVSEDFPAPVPPPRNAPNSQLPRPSARELAGCVAGDCWARVGEASATKHAMNASAKVRHRRGKEDWGKFALLETVLNTRNRNEILPQNRVIAKTERVSGLRYNW